MDRPFGSGGGQPAGMTIGSLLRTALKAYVGGQIGGSNPSAPTDVGQAGLAGAVGPEEADNFYSNPANFSATPSASGGGFDFAKMANNVAQSKIGGKGNQQFNMPRVNAGQDYNSGVIQPTPQQYYEPTLKFFNYNNQQY